MNYSQEEAHAMLEAMAQKHEETQQKTDSQEQFHEVQYDDVEMFDHVGQAASVLNGNKDNNSSFITRFTSCLVKKEMIKFLSRRETQRPMINNRKIRL